jgi:hypothetical protein
LFRPLANLLRKQISGSGRQHDQACLRPTAELQKGMGFGMHFDRPAVIFGIAILFVWGGSAALAAQAKVRPLAVEEQTAIEARLSPDLVPALSGKLQFDPKQSFRIELPAQPFFTVVPARYPSKTKVPGRTVYRCGLFVAGQAESAKLVPTLGYDWTETEECSQLEGLGLMNMEGQSHPRILLLYAASSANAQVKEPVVLDWDEKAGQYAGNEALSTRLENESSATTIAAIKRLLRSYEQKTSH